MGFRFCLVSGKFESCAFSQKVFWPISQVSLWFIWPYQMTRWTQEAPVPTASSLKQVERLMDGPTTPKMASQEPADQLLTVYFGYFSRGTGFLYSFSLDYCYPTNSYFSTSLLNESTPFGQHPTSS